MSKFDPDAFIANLKADPFKVVEVDVSQFLDEPAGTTLFTFQEPSTEQIFRAQEDAKKIKRRGYTDFTEGLGATVALIAMGHIAPAMETPKGVFYSELAVKQRRMFMYLVSKFMEAFPHLKDFEEATNDQKND